MILVIDFGAQYSHLIARRIRQLKVYSEIIPWTTKPEQIRAMKPEGIILSGGPMSVYGKNSPSISAKVLALGIPVLGLCYGHQLIAHLEGGKVVSAAKEYGKEMLKVLNPISVLKGLKKEEQVWMSHGDSVEKLPSGYVNLGSTQTCANAAFANEKKKIFGVQFHPEVEHTKSGMKILDNFIDICNAKRNYSLKDIDKKLVLDAREKLGNSGVIMAVSGGVDSLVAAVVLRKASQKVHLVFVDNGLLRKNEAESVRALFRNLDFDNFHFVDASEIFLKKLKGISDPEQKRKIIGNTFVEVFERKANELKKIHGEITFLGQGTIYPDRVESGSPSKSTAVIKTHHNVGGLPEKMRLKVIEPLADLYKDEVRELGLMLGIPKESIWRHPFPGPGLAVRIVGGITKERLSLLREADSIFINELKSSGYYSKTWQAFAALLPIRSVGVMGDSRTYGYIVSLRAVTSSDAMTADWAKLPHDLLESISTKIVKSVPGINRVVYDITQKPPATIEYE